ncbi:MULTISPECIES: porin [unclassified Duganella]|uniref:porin n=1 Tax=unclassified Duganella TaxID=2636909 RepID=UPI0008737E21|nr:MULTISPECIES: porin [unclassified Duganella]OEZ63888.1 outer membrane porin protein 32 precursor [Duganella sp. HH105]OFA06959.1 outer membrane porin protein 32 precursor [Duganella sp. HH101]
MNNKFNLTLLLAALAPAAALAQSGNITFYGKLDVALDSVRFSSAPGKAATSARYLSNDISYWGLRGSEDLGDGTRAYFKLESGFSADTGTSSGGNQLFDREALVGYGGKWGSLQLGSQYAPSLFVQVRSDPFGRNQNGNGITLTQQIPGNLRGFVGQLPLNNAVQYISPALEGVSVRVLYSFSERAAAPKDLGEFTGGSIDYFKGGPLYVGASYEVQKLPGASPSEVWSNKTATLGATYAFAPVKLFGYLMHNTLTGKSQVNAQLIGATIPLGLADIKATYSRRKIDDTAGGKTNIVAVGYFYHLSKRTDVYTSVARLDNGAATNFGIWPSDKTYAPPVVAGGSGLPVLGQDITSIEVGFRHFF